MLLWFWPKNKQFDFKDCEKFFNIDGCHLTDNRSLVSKADGILFFHEAIKDDLSNLPRLPRPGFQRWIWFNMESPNNTLKIPGIHSLFNLTLNYRQDADIQVRWRLTVKKRTDEDFVLPKKKRLLCWIVGKNDPQTGSGTRYSYYRELVKHIKVDVFGSAFGSLLKSKDYFSTISCCKFYLAFENSISKDYITEKFNGPLAVGTVPIVLGPPRQNYEDFVPGDSFIHVNDFPDAKTLAEFLLKLDKDNEAYMHYFKWRKNYSAKRHLIGQNHEFSHAICLACAHIGRTKEYRVVRDLNKWYFG
ncbi:4-galactosyl-N-acetylglucosaminide 3-alpha-L-fucosyltransferase 9-like [Polymixia lowei]